MFQAVFVGTAATIFSGAVAERMKFSAYICGTLAIALLIYPLFGHWAWGNLLLPENPAWLADKGFIDFAGSTVVHSIGAWIALAAIIVLGPRIGKFNADGTANDIQGYSPVLAAAGAMILLVGWIGFNGGSTTAGTPEFAAIIVNTIISAVFGGGAALFAGWWNDKLIHPMRSINGMLGGLVAITAGCYVVGPHGAAAIGTLAGITVVFAEDFIEKKLRLDDVVGAVSVHGVCGALGTLLLAFFARPEHLLNGSVWAQLTVQATGVAIAFVWAFGISFALFKVLATFDLMRVSEEDELKGLNVAEHGVSMGTGEIQRKLIEMTFGNKIDLSSRLDENTGDESAEIAQLINPFVSKVHRLVGGISAHVEALEKGAHRLEEMSEVLQRASSDLTDRAKLTSDGSAKANMGMRDASVSLHMVSEEGAMVSKAAEAVATEMVTISATVEELANSVEQIARNANSTADVSHKAQDLSSNAATTVSALNQAANHITSMVQLITDIAEKTNLLALNATIEASRAGEAGKGFAVVAQEVKNLSLQTAKAVDEIKARVENMQMSSNTASDQMTEVQKIIEVMNSSVEAILETTRSQNAATREISASISLISDNATDMSERMTSLSEGVAEVVESSERISQTIESFSKTAEELGTEAVRGKKDADDMRGDVSKLKTISVDLKQAVAGFKI